VLAGGQVYRFDRLVICAGLQSDRLAVAAGYDADPRIVPFLGMYYRLVPAARNLVRGLIYPVPDPRFPFLGVHLTRTVHDDVLVGPNAVLGLAREAYRATGVNLADIAATLGWPGFRLLARRYWRAGMDEMVGAASRRRFLGAARRYVPELSGADIVRAPLGVRAQAVARDGKLVDDFALSGSRGIVAVRNAPSPAATSSFAIADYLVPRVLASH
jgi:L-2-hydroxyglutarate oxidase LhgO